MLPQGQVALLGLKYLEAGLNFKQVEGQRPSMLHTVKYTWKKYIKLMYSLMSNQRVMSGVTAQGASAPLVLSRQCCLQNEGKSGI